VLLPDKVRAIIRFSCFENVRAAPIDQQQVMLRGESCEAINIGLRNVVRPRRKEACGRELLINCLSIQFDRGKEPNSKSVLNESRGVVEPSSIQHLSAISQCAEQLRKRRRGRLNRRRNRFANVNTLETISHAILLEDPHNLAQLRGDLTSIVG
jgi:hypothetical protein